MKKYIIYIIFIFSPSIIYANYVVGSPTEPDWSIVSSTPLGACIAYIKKNVPTIERDGLLDRTNVQGNGCYGGYNWQQYFGVINSVTAPTPVPTIAPPVPQKECEGITGKSFWGSQKGSTNQNGCLAGCATTSSDCAYVPPLIATTIVSCKMTVTGLPCLATAASVQIGTPTANPADPTSEPQCANYYTDKTGKKVCMNASPAPTILTPYTPKPNTTPAPLPTDANGKPILNPDGTTGQDSAPPAIGGTGGTNGGPSSGPTLPPGQTPNPNATPSASEKPEGNSGIPDPAGSSEFFNKKYEKTVSQVFQTHTDTMAKSPVITAAKSYFTLSVTGSCPTWTIPSVMGMPSIPVDQFCSQIAYQIYLIIKTVLLIAASFVAFRIAILD